MTAAQDAQYLNEPADVSAAVNAAVVEGERREAQMEQRAARWWAEIGAADNAIADAGGDLRSEDDPTPLAAAIRRLAAERDETRARADALGAAALTYYRATRAWHNSTLGTPEDPPFHQSRPIQFGDVIDATAALLPL